jgi:hypothetical protein
MHRIAHQAIHRNEVEPEPGVLGEVRQRDAAVRLDKNPTAGAHDCIAKRRDFKSLKPDQVRRRRDRKLNVGRLANYQFHGHIGGRLACTPDLGLKAKGNP